MKVYDLPFIKNTLDNEEKIQSVLVLLEDAYKESSSNSITNRSMARLSKQTYDALASFLNVVKALNDKKDE
jgi:hypothetical protein